LDCFRSMTVVSNAQLYPEEHTANIDENLEVATGNTMRDLMLGITIVILFEITVYYLFEITVY
jgi:hypothetical protein